MTLRMPLAALACCAAATLAFAQTPATPGRIKVGPTLTLQQLRSAPPTAEVETRNGTVVSAQRFLRLAEMLRNAQGRSNTPSPGGFTRTTAPATVVVRPGTHVPSLLTRPDSDVVQLPNGTRLTVGDMKKLADIAPRVQGRALATSTRADLSGPATRISSARDLRRLQTAPDSTVLESPQGVRITLGELRAAARAKRR